MRAGRVWALAPSRRTNRYNRATRSGVSAVRIVLGAGMVMVASEVTKSWMLKPVQPEIKDLPDVLRVDPPRKRRKRENPLDRFPHVRVGLTPVPLLATLRMARGRLPTHLLWSAILTKDC